MIPEEKKRGAKLMVLACFGLVLIGTVMGLIWINIYQVR
jgi:hypothetical protein